MKTDKKLLADVEILRQASLIYDDKQRLQEVLSEINRQKLEQLQREALRLQKIKGGASYEVAA